MEETRDEEDGWRRQEEREKAGGETAENKRHGMKKDKRENGKEREIETETEREKAKDTHQEHSRACCCLVAAGGR